MSRLLYIERPANGAEAAGLVILHHGRGTDELDLIGLADVLDPDRRLHFASVRGPLRLPGSPGYHWYVVPRVGHPDPDTFYASRHLLSEVHDELGSKTGVSPERTVLGGFSQGTVMSFAMGLDPGRPAPAGILAFSGFIPQVDGWEPDFVGRRGHTRAFIAHGANDPVISVDYSRSAQAELEQAGLEVEYHESGAAHSIDPRDLASGVEWLNATIPPA